MRRGNPARARLISISAILSARLGAIDGVASRDTTIVLVNADAYPYANAADCSVAYGPDL